MQAVVEKVMRAFALIHSPIVRAETDAGRVRQEANDLARELLRNYSRQLAQRAPKGNG